MTKVLVDERKPDRDLFELVLGSLSGGDKTAGELMVVTKYNKKLSTFEGRVLEPLRFHRYIRDVGVAWQITEKGEYLYAEYRGLPQNVAQSRTLVLTGLYKPGEVVSQRPGADDFLRIKSRGV